MNINRLGLYFKNYKELNPPDLEMVKRFNLVIEEFNTITSKDIIDVSNYGYNFIVTNKIKTITDQAAHLRRQLISNVNSLKRILDNCHKMINVDKSVITLDTAEKVISLIDSIKRDINNLRGHINQNISCKLDDILSFVKEKFGTNNKYEINIYGDIPPGTQICIPKKELEKILVIILQNAFEAYSEISLPLKVTITLSKKGNVILMEIQDYGTGIKKENLDKIFNKGFSTKAKGHGFGLHYVKSVVEEFGGTVSITSELEKGTQVILSFITAS
jgi:signal transduction histidine kinase